MRGWLVSEVVGDSGYGGEKRLKHGDAGMVLARHCGRLQDRMAPSVVGDGGDVGKEERL